MAQTSASTRFATEWDTAPNPVYDVWTSVNGAEVLPGVISPLVATTFTRLEYELLRRAMAAYPGGEVVRLVPPPGANFFGMFGGRLALNNGFSVAFASLLDAEIAQVILQQFFTGATGGERFIADVDDATRAEAAATAHAEREAAPAVLAGWQAALYAERSTGRFRRDRQLDLSGAWHRWVELWQENFFYSLNTHFTVSLAAGESQVILGGVIALGGGDPNVVVALCSGLGEVESAKPGIRLYELAASIRERTRVRSALEDGDLDDFAARLAMAEGSSRDVEGWAETASAFRRFLFEYGYRGQGEVDPTNPDWAEEPRFVLSQIRSMLALDEGASPSLSVAKAVAARRELEDAVRAGLPAALRTVFDDALARAQHFTRLRELSKATWVLGARRARAPYLALCRNLVQARVVEDPEDAKFLTYDEVAIAAGGASLADTSDRVARRRMQADEAAGFRLPDNWVGLPEPMPVGDVDDDAATLAGLGVSAGAGRVTGRARVIVSAAAGLAHEIDPGDVLVAPFTDAPWTPLFIVAGAVVVETGGVLSHAATVARELGIPAAVMVADATRIIRDGDIVSVDGATGTVTIVERA